MEITPLAGETMRKRLARLHEASKLSVKQVVERSGLLRSTVIAVQTKSYLLPDHTAMRLAYAYGVRTSWLFWGEPPGPSDREQELALAVDGGPLPTPWWWPVGPLPAPLRNRPLPPLPGPEPADRLRYVADVLELVPRRIVQHSAAPLRRGSDAGSLAVHWLKRWHIPVHDRPVAAAIAGLPIGWLFYGEDLHPLFPESGVLPKKTAGPGAGTGPA